eukprot:14831363-Heterocapsa_arctica.AAC.1
MIWNRLFVLPSPRADVSYLCVNIIGESLEVLMRIPAVITVPLFLLLTIRGHAMLPLATGDITQAVLLVAAPVSGTECVVFKNTRSFVMKARIPVIGYYDP